jgi:DNA-3-methyladenine glycosylase I
MQRCAWATDDLLCAYHDTEWGAPLHDDRMLFEFLCLEGAQAGLSWRTVAKRERYREVFHGFDIARVARMSDRELEKALLDPGIIRNRLKVTATRDNARTALTAIEAHGSLDAYLWSFVDGKPVRNRWKTGAEVPATVDYTLVGRDASWNATCSGSPTFNNFYGNGLVDAAAAVALAQTY